MSADDVGSRSLKRGQLSKEDSDLDATVPYTLQRHPDFWFDDGTIILVAQQTGFRVYRGLLASQSTVFSDMLSASSSSFDESLDGCPIVQLTDSPQDLAYLFGVLIPRSPIQCVIELLPDTMLHWSNTLSTQVHVQRRPATLLR